MSIFTIKDGRWCNTQTPEEGLDAFQLRDLALEMKKVECITDKFSISDTKKKLLFSIINATEQQITFLDKLVHLDEKSLVFIEKKLFKQVE